MNEFNATADDLISKLSTVADGKTMVNMADYLDRFALDVIGKVKHRYTLIIFLMIIEFYFLIDFIGTCFIGNCACTILGWIQF